MLHVLMPISRSSIPKFDYLGANATRNKLKRLSMVWAWIGVEGGVCAYMPNRANATCSHAATRAGLFHERSEFDLSGSSGQPSSDRMQP
jgi:hypothetical protein